MTEQPELVELRAMIEEVSRFAREVSTVNAEQASKLIADVNATYAEAIAHVTRHLTSQQTIITILLRALADAGIDLRRTCTMWRPIQSATRLSSTDRLASPPE